MRFERASGILLHPTSLPGPYGIGDLGPGAHRWLEFLAACGCKYWQILPLGPTGYGDSPYQCFSAFAGNPYLISPDALAQDDLLSAQDLEDLPDFPASQVDFGAVIPWKLSLLDRAFAIFERSADPSSAPRIHSIPRKARRLAGRLCPVHGAQGGAWRRVLDILGAPLEGAPPGSAGAGAPGAGRAYPPPAISASLPSSANGKTCTPMPASWASRSSEISRSSSPTTAQMYGRNPDLFFLDKNGRPSVVAGVPPDYFSPTGQLWGNPLYRWRVHKARWLSWWLERIAGRPGNGRYHPLGPLPRLCGVLGSARQSQNRRERALGARPRAGISSRRCRTRWASCP